MPGIWLSLAMAAVFSVSLLVRRPLVGVIWNPLRNTGPDRSWRADTVTLHAFDVATPAFVALFAARFVVQQAGRCLRLQPSHQQLGWDTDTALASPRGMIFPVGSFGHTGFTGVTLWIAPVTHSPRHVAPR